jgi:tripartite-type tricarboxylate transporter receptor subunit TctC
MAKRRRCVPTAAGSMWWYRDVVPIAHVERTGTFTAHPFLHEKLSYNPEGLIPIARVTNTLVGVSVPTALNVNSLAEFMKFVRSQPGLYHWASVTGATDLIFSGFLKLAGVSMVEFLTVIACSRSTI